MDARIFMSEIVAYQIIQFYYKQECTMEYGHILNSNISGSEYISLYIVKGTRQDIHVSL